ncbi:MAG: DUF2946 domain-containing protein [Pseudomonadota bacterium]
MGMKNVTRRIAAWIACCAILFAALAPSISQAVTISQGGTWAEICSASGTRLVKIDAGDTGLHFAHCPFCATHAAPLGLLPSAGFVLPLLETRESYPSLFYHAPRPLPIWTAAQSRAPPVPV